MWKQCFKSVTAILICGFVLSQWQGQSFAEIKVKEEKFEKNHLKATYPQFSGIDNAYAENKINMDIQVLIGKFLNENVKNEYNKEAMVAYKVHYMDKEKISFEITMYAYNGGAHGITVLNGYTYDLKTGEKYSLPQLLDFRPSEINQKIFAYAKAKDVFLFTDFKGIRNYPSNFYLNEKGNPVILFQQYEIAPYSSGILKIEM